MVRGRDCRTRGDMQPRCFVFVAPRYSLVCFGMRSQVTPLKSIRLSCTWALTVLKGN